MNLDSVRDRTGDEVRVLVEAEVAKSTSPSFATGLKTFLVKPRLEMRTWDWHQPLKEYQVWIVAESSRFDYGIAFSDYGFGPEYPWGLVFSSHSNFDADYCWFSSLEEAYKDSRLIEEYEERQRKG
jgi:hypothetical protein